MLVRAALVALALALAPFSIPPVDAVSVIPDEPGATVLPDASILQAVVADLDADGSRELVRLVSGKDGEALAEAWQLGGNGWALVDEPIQVLRPSRDGPRSDPVYAGVPLRMLVHRVSGVERVVVASQPRYEEIDSGPACCLVLHEIGMAAGELTRVAVAQPTDPVGGILAIDLDGDDTDELLTTLSLPPLGDISYPVEARVYRWTDGAFGAPTVSELRAGSGDTPFIIGDSDGRPGDEAAFISTLGPPGLFRIMLGPDDSLSLDPFGTEVTGATAVPLAVGRGIAVSVGREVRVHAWPAFQPPEPASASAAVREGVLLGAVGTGGTSQLLVHQPAESVLHVLGLPGLFPAQALVAPSAAAEAFSGLPLAPYIGRLPGGGPGGEEAVLYAGSLLPSPGAGGGPAPAPTATLAGAVPVGLLARGEWIAILHAPHGSSPLSASGGRFDSLVPQANAWLSVAPVAHLLSPELEDGRLEPLIGGARPVGAGPALATGRQGFTAEIKAPPGTRILGTDLDPSVVSTPITMTTGVRSVPVVPPVVVTPNPRYRTALMVVTPTGHSYVATWDVRVLTEPPPLEVRIATPFGSSEVSVSGRTAPDVSVRVGASQAVVDDQGSFDLQVPLPPWPTEIEVVATDFTGNVARSVVNGVGIFDYRGLPWIPIVAAMLALVGAVLYLRVPRSTADLRPVEDDAVLEEVEPE